jgi:hypothetical protein
MASLDRRQHSSAVDLLRKEFRDHLALFYSRLRLAPPYESVEQAVRHLAATAEALPASDQQNLLEDATQRWAQFRRAFVESGLSQKHRGIIAGLVKNRSALDLPQEYDAFLAVYVSGTRSE